MYLSREDMADLIHELQRRHCAYDIAYVNGGMESHQPSMCDCKYGADNLGKGSERGNGCPELREIYALLKFMKDKEFKKIVERMERKNRKLSKKAYKKWKKGRNIVEDSIIVGIDE